MQRSINRTISALLLICIMFSHVATPAMALNLVYEDTNTITTTITENANEVVFAYTEEERERAEREARSLEVLKQLDGVSLDHQGNVIKVNTKSEDFTDEELQILLGSSKVAGADFKAANLTEEEYTEAVEFHGSPKVLGRELSAYNRGIEEDSLNEVKAADIKQLICSGYSYRQARAAIVAAEMLNISVDRLCEVKEEELTSSEEEQDEEVDVSAYALTSGVSEEIIDNLSTKLCIPVSIVEGFAATKLLKADNILETFEKEMDMQYPSVEVEELEVNAEIEALSSSITSNDTIIPEKVLDNPYDYKNYGEFDVNLSSGSYTYTETDLSIPGINGLDLEFKRIFDMSFANVHTPYVTISQDSTDQAAYTLRVTIAGGEIEDTGEYISDLWDYEVRDDEMNDIIFYDGEKFRTSEYEDALDYYQYLLELTDQVVYAVITPDGDVVGMEFDPVIKGIGIYDDVFVNEIESYDYLINENGLGHGWKLGFSSVEWYLTEDSEAVGYRLHLANGRVYPLTYDDSDVTGLNDLYFEWDENSYPGAAYSLEYADGKIEYFDDDGRNIAIVDRYGNKITLEYTTSGNAVTQIKITDTLGNIIIYKEDELGEPNEDGDYVIEELDQIYHSKHSLSLNGTVIRTYYSYYLSSVGQIRIEAVENEMGEFTEYSTSASKRKFNCFVMSPDSSNGTIRQGSLTGITHPNGLHISISSTSTINAKREIFGYSGFKERHALSKWSYNFDHNDGTGAKNERTAFTFGDYTGYYTWITEDATYTTTENAERYFQSGGSNIGSDSYINEYTFNYNHELTSESNIVYEPLLESEFNRVWPEIIGTYSVKTYSYNSDHLPVYIVEKYYEPGNTSSYMRKTYEYDYDSKGNVIEETLPNGMTTTYSYDSYYNLLKSKTYKQDANTTIVEQNTLTADRKAVASTAVTSNDALVGKTTYSYDTNGRLTGINTYTSASEYTSQVLSYDGGAQVTQIQTSGVTDVDGNLAAGTPGYSAGTNVEKTAYNTRGWPVRYTDANGEVTTVEYDGTGRITKVTYPNGGTDAYVYDVENNKVVYTNPTGYSLTYTYDPVGNLLEVSSSIGVLASYEYDSRNVLVEETIHSSLTDGDICTYYRHDNVGRLTEVGIQNTDGTKTPLETYVYNAAQGKTTHTTIGSGNAPDIVEVSYSDDMGNTTSAGRVYNGTEYVDTYTYDYLNNCTQFKSAYSASRGSSFTTQSTYDYKGNVLTEMDIVGNTVTNTYDWTGKLTQVVDAKNNPTWYTYDKLGRLLNTTVYVESGKRNVTKNYYDPVGSMTKQMTGKGTEISGSVPVNYDTVLYTYDDMKHLTSVENVIEDTASEYSTYTYDLAGNLLTVNTGYQKSGTMITGTPSTTTYTYNSSGKLIEMTDPLGKTESYTYDRDGKLHTKTDRDGHDLSYNYDNRGRMTAVVSSVSDGMQYVQYAYALNGSVLSVTDGTNTISYTYDSLGRVISESDGAYTKAYTYNIGDLRTGFTVSDSTGALINNTYTYDVFGRMSSVSGSGVSASYTYDSNDNLTKTTLGNGVVQNYTYNGANQPTQVNAVKSGTSLANFQYAYDLSGRQTSITDLDGRVTSYTYDSIGRLTGENRTAGITGTPYAKSYTYDGFSNRVELVENASETDYTYDAANRLLNSTAGGVVTQYTYNDRGDLLTAQEGTETATQYTYDVFGKQTAVVGEELNAAYTYYPDDLRKTKMVNGITTTYVWDGDQIVLELTAGAVRKYIRGLQLIACVSGDSISYYHQDGHGNVVQLSDTSGVVTRNYEYDAFGEQLNTDAADANPFRYCGEYYDAETGTYYLRARHYAVDLGRFTQQDPIMDGLNWYVYCENNPVHLIDPEGLVPTDRQAMAIADHIYGKYDMSLAGYSSRLIEGWRLIDMYYGSESLVAGIYIREGDNWKNPSEYVIAFRGSVIEGESDLEINGDGTLSVNFRLTDETMSVWKNNAEAFLSKSSKDVWDAIGYAEAFTNNHSQETTFVGHSKGGGEAIAAAGATGNRAITFNAANFAFHKYGISNVDNNRITNYYIRGEILESTIGAARIGRTKWLRTQEWIDLEYRVGLAPVHINIPNPIANHNRGALKRAFNLK